MIYRKDKVIRWGIMGLGNIAVEFADALKHSGYLQAAASYTSSRREYFEGKYNIDNMYDNYQDLVDDQNVDAIYIATVNSQHYENIKQCLLAGKHVLCEKAIWGRIRDLEDLLALAKAQDLLLAEAMTIYHMPLLKKIKQEIQSGKIGKIKTVKADLGSLKEADPNNRFFSKELGGGAMLDIGTYTLSLLRYFMPGKWIERRHICYKYETGVDEMWSISLLDDQGTVGSTNLSFRSKLPKRAIIAGENGYYEIDNYVRPEKAKLVYPDGKVIEFSEGRTADALMYEILDFEASILGLKDETYIIETLDVVKVMDELLTSEEVY